MTLSTKSEIMLGNGEAGSRLGGALLALLEVRGVLKDFTFWQIQRLVLHDQSEIPEYWVSDAGVTLLRSDSELWGEAQAILAETYNGPSRG